MADVFISYKRQDRPVVERLAGALQQLGFDVWWDFELLSGEDFRQVIRAVIDQCRAAVVVWSRASVESGFVLDEASYALRLGRLCPVRVEAVELPFGFGQRHVDDLSDWAGELSHPGFQSLVRSIEDRVGRKARLGADASTPERQAASAELEAFKAAQLAATVGALRTFVANFPGGSFAPFVRDQIEAMEKQRPARGRPRDVTAASAAASSPELAEPRSRRWLWLGAAVAVAVAAGFAFYGYRQAQLQAQQAAEAAKREVEAERAAARRRAQELEAQAAAERAARERAEQRTEALQLKAEQERQAREKAAWVEADRKRAAAAFSVESLHRDVRAVVVAARRNAQDAEGVAARARSAAGLAEAAAARAAAGAAGTISLSYDGGTYQGEGRDGKRNGYGVTVFRAPSSQAGDRFAGQYKDNMRQGLGVHTFAENANNTSKLQRREGEYTSNRSSGLGILVWVWGERYAGPFRDGEQDGPSVRTFADGRRYEGEYAASKRTGLGVLWSADGVVVSQGVWKDGKLVSSLAP